jgi:hypothetical protein
MRLRKVISAFENRGGNNESELRKQHEPILRRVRGGVSGYLPYVEVTTAGN